MLEIKSISPSRIKTFDMCKYKYFLTYCTDEVLRSNWGAAHGTLVHDVLENYSNGNDSDWMTRLYSGYGGTLETLDRYQEPETMESPLVWAKPRDYSEKKLHCDSCSYADQDANQCGISLKPLDELPGCPEDLFEESVTMITDVIKNYEETWEKVLRDENGAPIGCEYKFNIKIAGTDIPLIGYMDLVIEEDPETIHVIDYKAGAKTQDYQECLEDIQVQAYSLAARREFIDDVNNHGFKYKNIILTFDYFRNKPITVALSKEDDDRTEAKILEKIKEIQSTKWINRIIPSDEAFDARTSRGGYKYWKCKYLCDDSVCRRTWRGRFKV